MEHSKTGKYRSRFGVLNKDHCRSKTEVDQKENQTSAMEDQLGYCGNN